MLAGEPARLYVEPLAPQAPLASDDNINSRALRHQATAADRNAIDDLASHIGPEAAAVRVRTLLFDRSR